MNVNPNGLRFTGSNPYYASHKFVVEALDTVVSIYVVEARSHKHVALKFNLPEEELVGGGSCYLNKNDQLVLDDFSGYYNAIPKEIAQKFAELMIPELKKIGVKVKGIAVNPSERDLHYFWYKKGFSPK